MGATWEVTLEGGGGADSISKVLTHGSAGGNLVWSGDMGSYGDNDAVGRGTAFEFLEEVHT